MLRTSTVACLLFASMLAGCLFNNMSPTRQLSDQVYALNDQTRWGRIDLAAQRVAPAYRQTFVDSRREWGRHLAIADTEVSGLVLTTAADAATSTVEISWYDERTMMLRTTVLRQHWVKTDAGFLLDDESIADGDPALLVLPEDATDEADPATTAGGVSPARG